MKGTWPIRYQFQLSELSEVVESHCSFGLAMRGFGKDMVLTRSASEGYSQSSSTLSLRNFTVFVLI